MENAIFVFPIKRGNVTQGAELRAGESPKNGSAKDFGERAANAKVA